MPEEFQDNLCPIPPINSSLPFANKEENNTDMSNIGEISQNDVLQKHVIGERSEIENCDITENQTMVTQQIVTRPRGRQRRCGICKQAGHNTCRCLMANRNE